MEAEMQYVQKNGCCLNAEENMKLGLAIAELMEDLKNAKGYPWFLGKINGKYTSFWLILTVNCISVGTIKDYILCQAMVDGAMKIFWCSSSSWVFSELPKPCEEKADVAMLASVNNLFTGEFDQVLFEKSGSAQVIDAELGLVLQQKPITELDRLSYVVHQIANIFAVPKGYMKYTPAEKFEINEGFRGLSKAEACKMENWQFTRSPQDVEIQEMIARGEGVYNADCLDSVDKDFPKNSWSL